MNNDPARILVVDDNEHNRDMLTRRLQRQGYIVLMAIHGRQALEMLKEQRFDLMLLDIMMPELNGYQVLEQLKEDPAYRYMPVIMISAIDDVDSVARCIELGAEDYLFKPFNPVLLRARIEASLEKKRLRDQEQAYLKAVRRELEWGRQIQAGFLPESLPQISNWEVATAFHPARDVAGDFYDAFLLADNRLALVIADVCDKGVGAALYMALIRSLIRTHAELAASSGDEPLQAVTQTNSYIARHHQRSGRHMFSTLFFGVLDTTTGDLRYVNAGHYPTLLIGDSGVYAQLESTGSAIGLAAESIYAINSVQLKHGDLMVSYTDGLIEAHRPHAALFGEERLHSLLKTPATASEALARIEQALYSHLGDLTPDDDVTLLAVRRG